VFADALLAVEGWALRSEFQKNRDEHHYRRDQDGSGQSDRDE